MTVEEVLAIGNDTMRELVSLIRIQKKAGTRPLPSMKLVDKADCLSQHQRRALLDKVATLVDESVFGRAEMCLQFADLLHRALLQLHIPAKLTLGLAIYYSGDREIFRWQHAWVRIGKHVIDGNTDCILEHPPAPREITSPPFWGPIREVPPERYLREDRGALFPGDPDVENVWWPELVDWLQKEFPKLDAIS